MNEKFKLTDEEELLYKEKKRVLLETIKLFGSEGSFPTTNIYTKITMKEFVSEDFRNELYPILKKYTGKYALRYFRGKTYCNSNFYESYTKEEKEYLLDIFLSYVSKDSFSGYDFDEVIYCIKGIAGKSVSGEFILSKFFEKNIFSVCSGSYREKMFNYIDNILSNGKFENAEYIVNYIKENVPDYRGLSLIIMNDLVPMEERVKCLKKIYKQKDLPAFKKYIRDNMTNLQVLDIFIEAAIIQNNRVKEKEENIRKLWKDLFVSPDYKGKYIYSKPLKWKNEFSKKYIKYILDAEFMRKFYNDSVKFMETQQYNRVYNYESFLELITSSLTSKEIIEAVTLIPELHPLGKTFPSRFFEAFENNNIEDMRLLLKVFANWNLNRDCEYLWDKIFNDSTIAGMSGFSRAYNLTKDSDTGESPLDKFFSEYSIIDYNRREDNHAMVTPRKIENAIFTEIFINGGNYEKCKIINDDLIPKFGIDIEKFIKSDKDNSSWDRNKRFGRLFTTIKTIFESINDTAKLYLNNLTNEQLMNSEKAKSLAIHTYNRFLKIFESEETSRSLQSHIIESSNEYKDFKYIELPKTNSYYGTTTRKNTDEAFIEILEIFKELGENTYKLLNIAFNNEMLENSKIFEENIDNTYNAVKLVCAFEV